MRNWTVQVFVDGVDVVQIASDSMSGVGNVEDYRQEILAAADNLIAFIGREPSEFVIPDSETKDDGPLDDDPYTEPTERPQVCEECGRECWDDGTDLCETCWAVRYAEARDEDARTE